MDRLFSGREGVVSRKRKTQEADAHRVERAREGGRNIEGV